jgi:hypothetical protein
MRLIKDLLTPVHTLIERIQYATATMSDAAIYCRKLSVDLKKLSDNLFAAAAEKALDKYFNGFFTAQSMFMICLLLDPRVSREEFREYLPDADAVHVNCQRYCEAAATTISTFNTAR